MFLTSSKRAQFFALLADLSDEDGVSINMEDLEDLIGSLFDNG